jgi:DNA-directed RNA polymerase subunit alpha
MRETVMELLLNLKRVHFVLHGDEPQTVKLTASGAKVVTAKDFKLPSQVEIANPDQHIADLAGKASLELEATIERGLGYIPRDVLTKEKVDIGTIALDATFTPIRRVNYEVENMRVGDRTDFNRVRILIETNGTVPPRTALEQSIEIMIHQLKAIIGFQEPAVMESRSEETETSAVETGDAASADAMKLRVGELGLSARVASALEEAGIKTAAGLMRKTSGALLELDGIGEKAVSEISDALATHGLALKGE